MTATTTAPATATAAHVALQVLRWTGLALAWAVQYTIAVPCILLWRLTLAAFKVGFVGVLLLCLPVIGWIILALWLMLRHPAPATAAPSRRSMWRPWGI